MAEAAQASLNKGFVAIATDDGPIHVRFTQLIDFAAVGLTRDGLFVVAVLGEESTRETRHSTIVLAEHRSQ